MTRIFASIGECMIEMSLTAEGLYRRGFAGDTLNTAWGVRGLTDPARVGVRYVTRVGADASSSEMLRFIAEAGIDTAHIGREPDRPVGLYMIALQNGERSFSYWRDTSAARLLAADAGVLRQALADADSIYFSGITLAILSPPHRQTLLDQLADARARGAMIAFDANIRLNLWPDRATARAALDAGYRVATLALPTFPDEAELFGDTAPEATARRLAACGAAEIVVKNGAAPCTLLVGDRIETIAPLAVADPLDTTGAGDSFNAGYIAARLDGVAPADAARFAHRVAARVIGHRGALIDMAELRALARAEG